MNMFKHGSKASIPGFSAGPNYQKWKSRRNAYVTVNAGGFRLPRAEKTYDDLYARSSGKPTANLDEVTVITKGEDHGLSRQVTVKFTCFDKGTFIAAEKACLRPGGNVSVSFGYVDPAYGGGAQNYNDLRICAFNWTFNNKNAYECNFTAIGPTPLLSEYNMACQIQETGLTFTIPSIAGPDTTVPVSSIGTLIEYDANGGGNYTTLANPTWTAARGGHVGVIDEPLGAGVPGFLIKLLLKFNLTDPKKMLYCSLNYLVGVINTQFLSQITSGPLAGRKLGIDGSGLAIGGLCSGDPMRVVFTGGGAGTYMGADPLYGVDFDIGAPVTLGGSINLGNILFNKDFVVEAFRIAEIKTDTKDNAKKGATGKSGAPGVSIEKFTEALFDKVKNASGGWIQLALLEDPNNSKRLLIVNKNEGTSGVSPIMFDPIKGDGITRATSITCSPSMDDVYAVMANKTSNGQAGGAISNGLGRVVEAGKIAAATAVIQNLKTISAPDTGFTDSFVNDMEAALASIVENQPKAIINANANVPWPMKLNCTLDGTSGFAFGDLINSTAVPINNANICFRVLEVQHKIAKNDWETSLSAILDVI